MKAKQTNYERTFFTMIMLAWAVLAVVFNLAGRALPKAEAPVAKSAMAANAAASTAALAAAVR
jgi:hypothetical protein